MFDMHPGDLVEFSFAGEGIDGEDENCGGLGIILENGKNAVVDGAATEGNEHHDESGSSNTTLQLDEEHFYDTASGSSGSYYTSSNCASRRSSTSSYSSYHTPTSIKFPYPIDSLVAADTTIETTNADTIDTAESSDTFHSSHEHIDYKTRKLMRSLEYEAANLHVLREGSKHHHCSQQVPETGTVQAGLKIGIVKGMPTVIKRSTTNGPRQWNDIFVDEGKKGFWGNGPHGLDWDGIL